jgi:hypothetical protein
MPTNPSEPIAEIEGGHAPDALVHIEKDGADGCRPDLLV